jgi:hypothetical protein
MLALRAAATSARSAALERLVCLRPVLVAELEARPLGLARIAHPDLAVGMQPAAARAAWPATPNS